MLFTAGVQLWESENQLEFGWGLGLCKLFFRSSARGPSGLVVGAFDKYSEGLFEQDTEFFRGFISHSLSKKEEKNSFSHL